MTDEPKIPQKPQQFLPNVAILLCTYNGQHYLPNQLNSFIEQSYTNWTVYASDDGSQDDTLAILEEFKAKYGSNRLSIYPGPKRGFAANFLSLTCNTRIMSDFYAYADQDDIWEANKLNRAIDWLTSVPKDIPSLYCSRTRLVDSNNHDIGFSPLFTKPSSFSNALMQNIGGGNTMVFNNAARKLLSEAGDVDVVAHDWWAYLVITGCGGKVFYDACPSLRYRQHDQNLIGMNSRWTDRFARIKALWQGQFKNFNNRHIIALQSIHDQLTLENKMILKKFISARQTWFLPRLFGLHQSGIYRQTLLGNLGLITAAIFNKI